MTGSLRGGQLRAGETLRRVPPGTELRIRGLQVHHGPVDDAPPGRTALHVPGVSPEEVPRGTVLTSGPGIEESDRLLVALARPADLPRFGRPGARPSWPPADGASLRLHIGTAQADAVVARRGREGVDLPDGRLAAILRLDRPIATLTGDRGVLRRPSPGDLVAGLVVLDARPARRVSRRRASPERIAALATAIGDGDADAAADALVGLHGAVASRARRCRGGLPRATGQVHRACAIRHGPGAGRARCPGAGRARGRRGVPPRATHGVGAAAGERPVDPASGAGTAGNHPSRGCRCRRGCHHRGRRRPRGPPSPRQGRRPPSRRGSRGWAAARSSPTRWIGSSRFSTSLHRPTSPRPPARRAARRRASTISRPIGRIVRIEADLAWAAPAFERLASTALRLARQGPLTPAALRDATGTSRRVVMPLLEDLNRRGILARTPAGHVPGPRAPREAAARS